LTAAEMSRFKVYSNDMMHRFALLRPATAGGNTRMASVSAK
jgi:hypothetical protein